MLESAEVARTAVFLAPDTELGTFQIVRLLGSGGMGEVYLARDRALDRTVAIKVLRAGAMDPHHRARFEREARAASTLNHPNVAHIYLLGDTRDGRRYLAMEYVEGVSLDQRLVERLPVAEAAGIAIQMASALTTAHGAGIVHRDVKPANVIVRGDGVVKVLDFGLAKLVPPSAASHDATESLLTEPGLLVGTADYMAPEQVRGQDVDARADVWALGVVLYEMIAGRRPFVGDTKADVQAAVLQGEPAPLARVDASLPPELQRIVDRALHKDPGRRYQVMKDLLLDLEALRDEAALRQRPSGAAMTARIATPRSVWRAGLPWGLAAILAVVALALVVRAPLQPEPPAAVTQRVSAQLGTQATLPATDAPVALSRDGTVLAFVARPTGDAQYLYVRHLDQLNATLLDGTEGADGPCFSPDGGWIAFFAGGKLKKIPAAGGAVVVLADAPEPRGAWWADDGTIAYAPHFRRALMRVSSLGGEARPLTTLANGEISHRFPQVLPGGRVVLFTASTEVDIAAGATLVVADMASGARTTIHRGYFGRYLDSGHLLYVEDDTLFALPLDPRSLAASGAASRLNDSVMGDGGRGSAQFAVSSTGTMAYVHGRNIFEARPLAWMDRSGRQDVVRAEPAEWLNPEVSPDGRYIAMDIRANGNRDIWVYEWARGSLTRLTTEPTNEEFPVWTPDGSRIVYRVFTSSADPTGSTLAWKRADGTGTAQVLLRAPGLLRPGSWHPTRPLLAYVAAAPGREDDVMLLPIDGDDARGWTPGRPTALVNGAARERGPRFSPDGRWLAYTSNEAVSDQVYVQPFPGPGARIVVGRGTGPSWSYSRGELVFSERTVDYRHALLSVPYRVQNGVFQAEAAQPWAARTAWLRELSGYRMYALHPDGSRVAMAPPSASDAVAPSHLTLVFNLFDELRRSSPNR
jgi:Tol biopolymer transport system component/tRNA A-37 threonylcarbamoyl transferase component Bud32